MHENLSYNPDSFVPDGLEICEEPLWLEVIGRYSASGWKDYWGEYDEDFEWNIDQWTVAAVDDGMVDIIEEDGVITSQVDFGKKLLAEIAEAWGVSIEKAAHILVHSREVNKFYEWCNADEFLLEELWTEDREYPGLRPCPCCGGKATHSEGVDAGNGKMPDRVFCGTCFLEIEGENTPGSAIPLWNVRTPEAPTEVVALRAELDALREATSWERECDAFIKGKDCSFHLAWEHLQAARAEVDRLLEEGEG